MARPLSKGLQYFNFDVSFFQDRKVRRLQRRCGESSPMVYIVLLTFIYKEGYYLQWDEDTILDLADATKLSEEEVSHIIEACMEVELLSREMFERYHILTSHGIQLQYQAVCEQSKRKNTVNEYSLLGVSSEETPKNEPKQGVSSEETWVSSKETPKNDKKTEFPPNLVHKENKRKEKKNKENYYSSFSGEEEQEKEYVISVFFFRNYASPEEEWEKFKAFNNRPGAPVWDELTPKQKESALTMWRQIPEHPPRFNARWLRGWTFVYEALCSLGASREVRMAALSDKLAVSSNGDVMRLSTEESLRNYIEMGKTAEGGSVLEYLRPHLWECMNTFKCTKLQYIEV